MSLIRLGRTFGSKTIRRLPACAATRSAMRPAAGSCSSAIDPKCRQRQLSGSSGKVSGAQVPSALPWVKKA